MGIFKGTISIKHEDFGFIISEGLDDVYVSHFNFGNAIDRDEVLFQIKDYGKFPHQDFRQEAKVLKIIKRHLTDVVGELKWKKEQFLSMSIIRKSQD